MDCWIIWSLRSSRCEFFGVCLICRVFDDAAQSAVRATSKASFEKFTAEYPALAAMETLEFNSTKVCFQVSSLVLNL